MGSTEVYKTCTNRNGIIPEVFDSSPPSVTSLFPSCPSSPFPPYISGLVLWQVEHLWAGALNVRALIATTTTTTEDRVKEQRAAEEKRRCYLLVSGCKTVTAGSLSLQPVGFKEFKADRPVCTSVTAEGFMWSFCHFMMRPVCDLGAIRGLRDLSKRMKMTGGPFVCCVVSGPGRLWGNYTNYLYRRQDVSLNSSVCWRT